MDIKQAFIKAVNEVLPMYGMTVSLLGAVEESVLSSANQVNVVMGLSDGIRGNVIIGFKKTTAFLIASKMMGGIEIAELNELTESAIGEMGNMFAGYALGKIDTAVPVNFASYACHWRTFVHYDKQNKN